MHRSCRRLLAMLVPFFPAFAGPLAAQFVERAPMRKVVTKTRTGPSLDTLKRDPDTSIVILEALSDASSGPREAEVLQQAAIDYSPSGAKARLKIARLWLEVTDRRSIPIVIVANPTVLLPEERDSATFSAKELLSQFGGLLNIAAVRPWKRPGAIEGQKGTQGDLRVGAKLIEFDGDYGGAPSTTPVGHVGVSISHLMRAFGERPEFREPAATATQVGLVTLNLRGGVSYVGGERYRLLFRDAQGNAPPQVFATYQLDASVHLFDEFFLSAGVAGSTNKRLREQGFFGVTVSRSNKE